MKRTWIIIVYTFFVAASVMAQSQQDSIRRANRHDFVSKGNHKQELKTGDYIVVATTVSEEDAKKMLAEYKKLKVTEPGYAYLTNKSLWYLYFNGGKDIEEARQKRDELRKTKVFKDAWLLTVHD